MRLRDLPETFKDDMLSLLCGDELGSGMTRTVFACPLIDKIVGDGRKYVIKVERSGEGVFQNATEWRVWNHVKDRKPCYAKWLAPCVAISGSGLWLIQRRVDVFPTSAEAKKRAPKLPDFLGDRKFRNYGTMGRQVVCHDYGTVGFFEGGLRMGKAHWWGDT